MPSYSLRVYKCMVFRQCVIEDEFSNSLTEKMPWCSPQTETKMNVFTTEYETTQYIRKSEKKNVTKIFRPSVHTQVKLHLSGSALFTMSSGVSN